MHGVTVVSGGGKDETIDSTSFIGSREMLMCLSRILVE